MQGFDLSKSNLNRNGKEQKKFRIQAVSGDWLYEESTSEDDFEPVFSLNRKDGSIRLAVNGQNVKMVVDMGTKQNIISSRLYRALFRSYELHKTKKNIHSIWSTEAFEVSWLLPCNLTVRYQL